MNSDLAELAREVAETCEPRTRQRRAAAALYTALTTTKTPDAARRALREFAPIGVRMDALALLSELEKP